MTPRPLILAPSSDPHACALAWALERNDVAPVWIPALPTAPAEHHAFRIDGESESLHASFLGDAGISAVWNRRLHEPRPVCDDADMSFATWEWRMFQRSLFSIPGCFADALWVNSLAASRHAENKLVQLNACRRLGIAFPDTVVTTDADEVKRLVTRWGRVVFKSFLVHHWEERSTGRMHAVGVTLLDADSEIPAASVAVCPGIYQRYIEKRFDVRVTVIGDRMFAMSLGKTSGKGFVDWRTHTADADMLASVIELPGVVGERLRALMRDLGLVFGCIDLVVDERGDYHFLEVNQAGQFLFVEDMLPELPILQAMTALLSSARADYPMPARGRLRMADFWGSDRFRQLETAVNDDVPERPLFTVEP